MLTSSAVTNAKPNPAKQYRLSDERGLYLLVRPQGGKWWRFDYARPGNKKRNTLSLGIFPDVSLKQARERRDEIRKLIADGIDPAAKQAAEHSAAADTFKAIAEEWHTTHKAKWTPDYGDEILRRLEVNVFPYIGARAITSLTALDILAVLRRIEARGAVDLAHRQHQVCGQVFRYAIATGRATADPTPALRGAIPPAPKVHLASIKEPARVGELLRALHSYSGGPVVSAALNLAPLVFTRPGELRHAEWAEIDFDTAEWRIPAHKMKMRAPHIVPLSTQAVAILRDLHPLTGRGKFVFPSPRGAARCMSENAITVALRALGYDGQTMTGHGFRSIASTLLNEQGWNRDAIERQLAHAERDGVRDAYNYAEYLPERRKMMQAWADYLDGLRKQPGTA
ncbi:tyrosine-type recombinase/integrase [Metallibacterium scheffleri]|uniref:tyrosine-type recombinase/integrase n=1 Tax=Metallibacterium scheffleri TaxID=993689 RepID=UPI0023F41D14|nr:integrase arm-type DNA-binding domain-containing protein [Metallibacterium scheffleri]